MSAPGHIVIACSYLHVPGGYEKAVITTANLFAEKGHPVTLLILDHTADTWYPVHKDVKIVHQPVTFGITPKGNTISRKIWLWRDIQKLKRILKTLRPAYLICSEYTFAVAAVLGGARRFTRVCSWEHHHFAAQQLNGFWKLLFRYAYKRLDAVVTLNKDEQQYYWPYSKRPFVIPNFVSPPSAMHIATKKDPGFTLLSVTRFNHIKGIDLLMAAAKIILPQNPQLKWKVIGYGEQKDVFLDFIKKENLSAQLIYKPADKTDITEDYRDASLFVMTSRNECFPLVLLEAMSNGLPCIAFDCDTGPRHIIQQNKSGLLVKKENIQELAAAVSILISDLERREEMSRNALVQAGNFSPDRIYGIWKQLFS